jgi:hypothetical protein
VGWVCGGKGMGADEFCGFVALVCFECISTAVVEGACVRDYKGLRVCTVGTVG